MLAAFAPMKPMVSLGKFSSHSESFISLLHTKLTVIFFLTCSAILSMRQLIGESIACMSDGNIPARVINSWCWMNNTFTIPERRWLNMPYSLGPEIDDAIKYHAYYQWVSVVLFVQGVFFYLPRYLWKAFEDDLIGKLSRGLDSLFVETAVKKERILSLVTYFRTNRPHTRVFTLEYILLCEVLNFVNVLAQIWFVNYFLDGAFTRYEYDFRLLFSRGPESYSKVDTIFPKITKCTFLKYGPSGDIVNRDVICVLPLNIFNEKIYFFIWYWLVVLAIFGAMQLIFRFMTMFSVHTRYLFMVIDTITLNVNTQKMKILVRDLSYYDLFILSKLKRNMNVALYEELLIQLSEKS